MRGCCPALEGVDELLVKNSFVSGMLIDQNQTVLVLEYDVGPPQLKEWRDGLRRSGDIGGGNCVRVFRMAIARGRTAFCEQRRVAIDLLAEDFGSWIRRRLERPKAEAPSSKAE